MISVLEALGRLSDHCCVVQAQVRLSGETQNLHSFCHSGGVGSVATVFPGGPCWCQQWQVISLLLLSHGIQARGQYHGCARPSVLSRTPLPPVGRAQRDGAAPTASFYPSFLKAIFPWFGHGRKSRLWEQSVELFGTSRSR